MNSRYGLVLRAAALVVGSAVVGAGIASNPATAQDVNSMLKALSITTCSTSGACKQFKNTGSGAGVKGVAGNGNGVIAVSTNGSATLSTSTNGNGIQAYSTNYDAINSGTDNNSTRLPGRSGVYGHDDSTDGGSGNVGVYGTSTNGAGVEGYATNHIGVAGISINGNGGVFENQSSSEPTLIVQNGASGGSPLYAESPGGHMIVDSTGDVSASGAMYATAFFVDSDVITPDGRHVVSYASRSADAEMSDVGTGRIAGGHGIVQLDPAFARTLDMRAGYHVFLTPLDDCKGLFVAAKSPASFEVREMQGGQSTLSFDYRIIGRGVGVKSGRLPAVTLPAPVILRARAPLHVPAH
jgi:hypothetical protein